jgi:hypothetical protein
VNAVRSSTCSEERVKGGEVPEVKELAPKVETVDDLDALLERMGSNVGGPRVVRLQGCVTVRETRPRTKSDIEGAEIGKHQDDVRAAVVDCFRLVVPHVQRTTPVVAR